MVLVPQKESKTFVYIARLDSLCSERYRVCNAYKVIACLLLHACPHPGNFFQWIGEAKECDDAASDRESGEGDKEAPYEFSLDPDTKAAEKKLRRAVAKQVRCLSETLPFYDAAFVESFPIGQYNTPEQHVRSAIPMVTVPARLVWYW